MDFFQHQEVARKKTAVLVFYFCIAVALIVAAVYLAVTLILFAQGDRHPPLDSQTLWQPRIFVPVVLATVFVIGAGSLYKISQLRGGGKTVARMLGARPIHPSTRDLDERVLLNVVEEMAIASGISVPPVYVLDEERGINAFAAGLAPRDAVIGVTRGTLDTLTRDELQGVIAHEFSHILNGDMRLNLRLIGVLHGILLIALTGYTILRTLRHVRGSRGKKGGGVLLVVLLLGLAFLVIGYVGVFFGKLIKSAVSRQREFLADASAVQFTRNPGGIADALKKIGGAADGSRVQDERAEEVSHMFFGDALGASFLGLMSTHPPLRERIRRVDPRFDGKFPRVSRVQRTGHDLLRDEVEKRERVVAVHAPESGKIAARAAAIAFQPSAAVASVGTLEPERIDYAAGLIASLPELVRAAVHEPFGAVASVYCLLLAAEPGTRRRQLQYLSEHGGGGAYHEVGRLLSHVDPLGPEARLPLVEMAIPALYQLSWLQYRKFCETVERLITVDDEIDLFEQALERMLLRRLAAHFVKSRRGRRAAAGSKTLAALVPECSCLLSALAHEGQRGDPDAARAFARAAAQLSPVESELSFLPRAQCGLRRLDLALGRLSVAQMQVKKRVLEAAAACIHSDGQVTAEEAELLRILADALDCPMPPLVGRQVA